jgi:hypothetical protein
MATISLPFCSVSMSCSTNPPLSAEMAFFYGTFVMSYQNPIVCGGIDTTQIASINPPVLVNGFGLCVRIFQISLHDLEPRPITKPTSPCSKAGRSDRAVALLSGSTKTHLGIQPWLSQYPTVTKFPSNRRYDNNGAHWMLARSCMVVGLLQYSDLSQ